MKRHFRLPPWLPVLLVTWPLQLTAQWVQTSGPYGGYVTCSTVSNGRLYVGTLFGGVYVCEEGDSTWRSLNGDLPDGESLDVRAIAASGVNLFAATRKGVYSSTDHGTTWTMTNSELREVRALAIVDDAVFAGGYEGLHRSTDNGRTWSDFNAVFGAQDFFQLSVVGTELYAGSLYRTTDRGAHWASCSSGLSPLGGVREVGKLGTYLFAATSSGLYCSSDEGAHWTCVNSGLPDTTTGAIAVSGSNVFVSTASSGGVVVSSDTGKTWVKCGPGVNRYANGLKVVGTRIFATTDRGVSSSSDNGATWRIMNTGLANTNVSTLLVIGDRLLAGTCGPPIDGGWGGTIGYGLSFSGNDGDAWTNVDSEQVFANCHALAFFESKVFASKSAWWDTSETRGSVYVSTDSGSTWISARESLPRDTSVATFAVLGSNLFAVTWASGVYRSTGDSAAWTMMNPGFTHFAVLSMVASGEKLYVGTTSGVFQSFDEGATWTCVSAGFGDSYVSELAVLDDALFVGTIGGIYRSTDQGNNWSLALNASYGNAFATSGPNIFAAAGQDVFHSTDLGATWMSAGRILGDITSLAVSDEYLFAGTVGGGVWRRSLSEIVTAVTKSIEEIPQQFHLSECYPNPFNPSTQIEFGVPFSGHVSLTIFDLLGREMVVLVNEEKEAGVHTVTWDASGYPSGIYLCRLDAGSVSLTRKLLLVR